MSDTKPVFLLAGGGSRDPANMVNAFARVLQECKKQNPRVAYLGVANKDNAVFFNAIKSLLKEAGAAEVVFWHICGQHHDGHALGALGESRR